MLGLVDTLRQEVRAAARAAALRSVAMVLLLVGLAFLTAALWLFIVTVATALTAAVVIGALYCGVGLILLAMASFRSGGHTSAHTAASPTPGATPTPQAPLVQLAEGFAMGMQAGRAARSPGRGS
ncbi:phage holin family protein [Roseovarius sp. ZX-A-9]|uniref:phage holin family protein n=1 Tax=Roseovarius sp. ZX-A-9 TaxID=3014783 RepID=UPI00232C9AB0|nr:phage holin family protein [Roseovarius sp. ZX-A-9]